MTTKRPRAVRSGARSAANLPTETLETTMTIDRTPYCHKIRYGVSGAPILDGDDMDGSHAPGVGVRPTLIELIYSAARDGKPASMSASVTGQWTRFGKREPFDDQVTTHFKNGPDGWPAWLAEEARLHDPAVLPPPADRAAVLLEAAERLRALAEHAQHGVWVGMRAAADELRRLADEAQPECSASLSGNCLRESQSETACDTEAGECAGGGPGQGRLVAEAQHPEPPCCSDPTCTCVQVNADSRCECTKWDAEAQQPDTETRPSWTPGPVALARAADWATKRQDATVDPAMCPRCKGDNSEAFQLCTACATPEPPADQAAVLLWAADQIDAETRQLKADEVLEPDKFRPCRDASAQLRRMAAEAQQDGAQQ